MALFEATNESNSYASYYQRISYRDNAYPRPPLLPKPFDFWYDKPLYGRVDRLGDAIFANDAFVKKLSSFDGNVFALDFVADAYSDLKSYYAIAANTGKVLTNVPTNLITLEPFNGWQSANVGHFDYVNNLYTSFSQYFLSSYENKKKLINFDTYLKLFMEFIQLNTPNFPFTKTGYITSRWCDPATSGLIIELANDDFGDDSVKYNDYISDPNYIFYAFAAQKYGFKVDKNAPWRLVADLSSPVMRKYMKNYPKAPQIDRPPNYPYYYGDIVEVETLNVDPTIQGEEFVQNLTDLEKVKFRVSEVIPTRFQSTGRILYRLMLTPVQVPNIGIDVKTGVLYKKLQNEGILVDPAEPDKLVRLYQAGAGRQENNNKKSQYDSSVANYASTPKLSIDNLFLRRYYKSYEYDLEILKTHVLEFYNSYVKANPQFVIKSSSCSARPGINKRTILREQMSPQELRAIYDNGFWLDMYSKIRIAELDFKMTDGEKRNFLSKVSTYYKTNGTRSTLSFVNNYLNGAIKPKIMLTPPAKDAIILNTSGLDTLYNGDIDV